MLRRPGATTSSSVRTSFALRGKNRMTGCGIGFELSPEQKERFPGDRSVVFSNGTSSKILKVEGTRMTGDRALTVLLARRLDSVLSRNGVALCNGVRSAPIRI